MTLLDPRTTFLIAGALYIVMPAVTWLTLHRQDPRGAALWCGGGMLFGFGLILVGLRNETPLDALTMPLSSLTLGTAIALRLHALWRQTRPHIGLGWPLGFAVLQAGVYELLRQHNPQGLMFVVWAQSVTILMLSTLAHAAWELYRRESLPAAGWIGAAYAVAVLFLLLRLIAILAGLAPPSLVASAVAGQLVALISVMTSVLTNIGFLGIYLERGIRQRLQWEAEEARRSENTRMLHQFEQLDRQRGLGRLASSMAHELGQPLTFLQLHAERMRLEASRGPVDAAHLQQDLREILDQTTLAADILSRMRKFGHTGPGPMQTLALQELVRDALTLMKNWLQHEKVQVQQQVQGTSATLQVHVDPVAITQVVLNLVRNAAQAMHGQPQREITITLGEDDNGVRLCVEDFGPGFSAEALEKASRQTFSTKHDGMGLGLSIVRVITDQHGGRLRLGNTDRGAWVELWLPTASAQN